MIRLKQEHESVKLMWSNFIKDNNEDTSIKDKRYESWYFCNNEEDANKLVDLVRKGTKRGTASLHILYEMEEEPIPQVGDYNILTNWNGVAQCIVMDVNVHILPFKDVTEELAYIEGEGYKSLNYWRKVHLKFFEEEVKNIGLEFNEDMLIVFEEFRLVYPVD